MLSKNKYTAFFFWLAAAVLFVFLTLNRHSRSGIFNYHSEIWADKASYYVYLPYVFIYHGDAALLPDSIQQKTGGGFSIDKENNVIRTKTLCGVAIMQAPFFLCAHFLAAPLGYADNGFSLPYHRAIDIAAVFYLVLGLFFLWKYLIKKHSKKVTFFALFFLVGATNIYYYAIDETGMSHIYSFACFSAVLWLFDFGDIKKALHVLCLSLLFVLIFLVRPANIIFLFFLLLLEKNKVKAWLSGICNLNIIKTSMALLPAILILFSQIILWKYSTGGFFSKLYPGESFSNLTHPQFLKVWFSTNNGLFTYTPAWLFIICGIIAMIINKHYRGWIYLLFFFALSYMVASWWSWQLGCGFGHRAYVEYLAIFITPALFLWEKISAYKWLQYFTVALLILFTVYNLQMTYVWDGCWYGGVWDWPTLWQKFSSAF